MTPRAWNPHQNRWLNELLQFDFKISWVPGKEMMKADALSHQPTLAMVGQQEGLPLQPLLQPNQYEPLPEAPDLQICAFHSLFTEGPTEENDNDVSDDKLQHLEDDSGHYAPLPSHSDSLSLEAISHAQCSDPDLSAVICLLEDPTVLDPDLPAEEVSLFCLSEEGLLLFGDVIQVPDDDWLKLAFVHQAHNLPMSAHPSQERTFQLVARDFNWRGMLSFVGEYIRGCHVCQQNKSRPHRPYSALQPLGVPLALFTSISVDAIVKLPKTTQGYDSIMVYVCCFSKMPVFVPFTEDSFTEEAFANMTMDCVFTYWGMPDEIVSNRAWINVASAWTHFLRLLGTRPLTTTTYHSRGNGQVEHINLVLETMLGPYINTQQNDWDTYLGVTQMAYSTLQQTSTKVSPFYAAYGCEPLSALSHPETAQSKLPVAEQ
jgi:hypothetical protein